jgi:hypothetical protein
MVKNLLELSRNWIYSYGVKGRSPLKSPPQGPCKSQNTSFAISLFIPIQIFLLLIALGGCSSGQKQIIFQLSDKKTVLNKDATIAVIAASSSLPNKELVKKITAELSERNTLKVLRQEDINKVYKNQNEFFENTQTKEEILKETGNFHKIMESKYVYFVISNSAGVEVVGKSKFGGGPAGSSTYVTIPVDAYLVEYPQGTIIAETHYCPSKKVGLFSDTDGVAVKVIDMAAEKIVNQILKNIE